MKLTIEHLTPYLPYRIQLLILNHSFGITQRIFQLDCGHDFHLHLSNGNVKPVLKTLDLYNLIHEKFEQRTDMEFMNLFDDNHIDMEDVSLGIDMETLPYGAINWLARNHYDIFDLISNGLAQAI